MVIERSRKRIQKQFEDLLTRRELAFARNLNTELKRVVDEVAGSLEVTEEMQEAHQLKLFELSSQKQRITYRSFVAFQASLLDFNVEESVLNSSFNSFVNENVLSQSRLIADTSFRKLQDVLREELIIGGKSEAQVIKEILRVKQITKPRALMIARTESHNAATYAQREVANTYENQFGETLYKKWSPVLDSRTRDTHAEMINHPVIPSSASFTVGNSIMDRPGDPNGAPEEVINCRCSLLWLKEGEF